MGIFPSIELKLGNMRKPQEFTMVRSSCGKYILMQSDKCNGRLNVTTGEFIFTNKGQYSNHLALYGKPMELTIEVKNAILDKFKNNNATSYKITLG